jgi:hypothetical protein
MLRWLLTAVMTSLVVITPQENKPHAGQGKPQAGQPASAPATQPITRKPQQVDILQKLLERQARAEPIPAREPDSQATGRRTSGNGMGTSVDSATLLLEGTMLIERPGHFVLDGDRAEFVFTPDGSQRVLPAMEILRTQLLETLESEAQRGGTEFIISAEVTRYHKKNYIILRKVLRRVDNGNISP